MPQKIKYYLDENVPLAVARGLLQRGVDVLTTQDANMLGASDKQQLLFALREGRVIFTQDKDFLKMSAAGLHHLGIVYASHGKSLGEIIRGLMLIYKVLNTEEMNGHLEFI